MNREQTTFIITICTGPNWNCQEVRINSSCTDIHRRYEHYLVALHRHGNLSDASCSIVQAHVETASENSWVDPNVDVVFSKNGSSFLTILSVLDGTAGKFPQLCHIDIASKVMTPLTHGQIVVTNIKAWDQSNHVVYVAFYCIFYYVLRIGAPAVGTRKFAN